MEKNEERVCEAIIRILEQKTAQRRSAITRPEKDYSVHPDRRVEVRFNLGDCRYAIEHTLIEPFTDFLKIGDRFTKFAGEILDTLKGTMPGPGIYQLSFPINPTAEHKGAALAALRQPIIDWVRRAAEELFQECPEVQSRDRRPHGYNGKRQTEIGGLHLILVRSLHWSRSSKYDGFFDIARRIDDNLEAEREARIKTAFTKKLPKLLAWGDEGDVTVLVLEYSDIALTHHVLVAEAIERLIDQGVAMPDQVFIADTTLPRPWDFHQPIIDGAFTIEMERMEAEPPQDIGY
ncbi:hypothetical protein CO657_16395 [Rhizobium acidisoli]|uniref:Uncharacterized protein n=1 Tax=Rhizobium acidisoli TaxID=1538158 RepID=A0AAE5TZQ2_9HYPH|nr:hypothetical protein [Rhizobium acidisoli]KPH05971.1 hypothetical protein AOG23_24970 [Rhizobium acidisoli]QAS79541.1 hypothetical protein CO657_16395 [Rhizobium acidisoli]